MSTGIGNSRRRGRTPGVSKATGVGSPLRALALAVLGLALGAVLPVGAGAALPDGRVYEQVSPPDKNGNVVIGSQFGLASAEGDAVAYLGTGAMGAAVGGLASDNVSRRGTSGWS